MRSKWKKNIFVYNKKLSLNKTIYKKANYIIPSMLNRRIHIYNGKKPTAVLIKKTMLGLRLGEFIVTKKLGTKIHLRKKKKKK